MKSCTWRGTYGVVQRVGCRHGSDEDEHDEAHALLAVVGSVEEADAGAGEHHQRANGERRRGVVFGGFVEFRELCDRFGRAGSTCRRTRIR